jgi:hypothetical protein
MRKNAVRDHHPRRLCRGGFSPRLVNSLSKNIFNGLFRVPVNEKIPALNSI